MKLLLIVLTSLILSWELQAANWLDRLGLGRSSSTNQTSILTPGLNSLSQDQIVLGLKEALGKGVERAVSELGHENGFLTNLNVRIPMPEKLRKVETTLRALGQNKLADEFVDTMNHAAEQAMPAAAGVFADSIRRMTIQDATAILTGTNNAATEYFRRTTGTNLFEKFLPIVKSATEKSGTTAAYKRLLQAVQGNSLLGSFGSTLLNTESLDLDAYITNKSMDGLLQMVAVEEQRIRQNPVARTSELLQKVFGAVQPGRQPVY